MQEMIMTLHKIIFFTLYKNFIRFKNATSSIDRNEKGNLISLTIICNFTFLINIINLFTLEIKKTKTCLTSLDRMILPHSNQTTQSKWKHTLILTHSDLKVINISGFGIIQTQQCYDHSSIQDWSYNSNNNIFLFKTLQKQYNMNNNVSLI